MEQETVAGGAVGTDTAAGAPVEGDRHALREPDRTPGTESRRAESDTEAEAPDVQGAKNSPASPAKGDDWKARYDGLNGNFQQSQKQLQQAKSEAAEALKRSQQLERQNAELTWRLQGLNPGQIKEAGKLLDAHQALERRAADLDARDASLKEMAGLLEPQVRKTLATEVASKYQGKVDAADLSDCETLQEMERVAAKLASKARDTKLADRKEKGTDKAESGGSSRTDTSKMSAFDLIRMGVRQTNRR